MHHSNYIPSIYTQLYTHFTIIDKTNLYKSYPSFKLFYTYIFTIQINHGITKAIHIDSIK